MADDKRVAKRKLEEMLMVVSKLRRDLEEYRNKGDVSGVALCERWLKHNHSRIREHCAEHDLERPRDVPPEGAG